MRTRALSPLLAAAALAVAAVTGCSDLKTTLPAATTGGIQVHPQGWTDTTSASFHGNAIKADNWDLSPCQKCHGTTYTGGTSGVSCLTCHTGSIALTGCRVCHGGTSAAPPKDLDGNTTRLARGVGAHQFHLVGSGYSHKLVCRECHTVPSSVSTAGHIDDTPHAEVAFNDILANTATSPVTPAPTYNANTLTCSGTYCHGTFRNGNTSNSVLWNGDAGTGAECGTCHGDKTKSTVADKALPKTPANGGTHPNFTRCAMCHNAVINASYALIDSSKHVDGQVSLFTLLNQSQCNTCHGSATNAAPPNDASGNTVATARGVGAHQAHLLAGTASAVACAECHTVPTTLDYTGADGHLDAAGGPAEVAFNGTLSKTATTGITPNPAYNSSNLTCSGSYCHGNFVNGNTTNAPVWNAGVGVGAECGTCHGDKTKSTIADKALPKTTANGGTHPNFTQCSWCHDAVVNATTGFVDVTKHVNGVVNVFQYTGPADCSHCHGSGANPAPPNDLSGNTAVTARGVGAHQAHLVAVNAKTVKCAECHTVPSTLDFTGADGHIDATAGAEVLLADTLARLATSGVTPNPQYDSNTQTCSSVYCHGAFKNGNTTNTVVWNSAAGTGAVCGTCHGTTTGTIPARALPKTTAQGGTHTTNTSCSACHSDVVDAAGNIIDPLKHINGKLNRFGVEVTF